jgi:hypothetical protein
MTRTTNKFHKNRRRRENEYTPIPIHISSTRQWGQRILKPAKQKQKMNTRYNKTKSISMSSFQSIKTYYLMNLQISYVDPVFFFFFFFEEHVDPGSLTSHKLIWYFDLRPDQIRPRRPKSGIQVWLWYFWLCDSHRIYRWTRSSCHPGP